MPISKTPGACGNLKVNFEVVFPSTLTAAQKAQLEQVL